MPDLDQIKQGEQGAGAALTRRAVELALVGDPTAMRLCFERILPPFRGRTVKLALPPIKTARTVQKPVGRRPVTLPRAMKAVTSGAGQRRDHAGRGGQDRGGGRHLRPGDRCPRFRSAPAGTRKRVQGTRCGPHSRVGVALALQPLGESLLQILLQMQQHETIPSNVGCGCATTGSARLTLG